MTPCPVCGKPVDALRAPAARVQAGKVVAYCSKECAQAAETKPTPKLDPAAVAPAIAAKRTPAKGTPAKRTPASGVVVPASARDLDSGPVIEILHEPASGVVTSAGDVRVSGAAASSSRVEADGAIQIADTGHLDDYVDVEPRSRTGLVVLLLLLAVSAGVFAAYQLGYLDELLHRGSDAAVVPPHREPAAAPAPADAALPVTADAALDRARTVLRTQIRSDSPRIQRIAASALARTGDPEALTQLANGLPKETSDIARLDIAYALARGGDKRGVDALVQALTAPRRDVKAEAAGRLALLGDKRAVPVLVEFLEISQHRLSAAEQLAPLADPRALDALDKIIADDKASPDDKARAAIALGYAGKAEVAPALRALLTDARFNAFAAAALASLHDAAARPVLVKQLEFPSLRIGAARALRRLEPALDPMPLLPGLLAALGSAKDTEQVQAAEAILLIAGPVAWSEHE